MDQLEEKLNAFGEAYAKAADGVDYEIVRKRALQEVVSAIRKEITDTVEKAIEQDAIDSHPI